MILKATAFFHAFHKHPEGLAAARTKVIRSIIMLVFVVIFNGFVSYKAV